MKILITGATGYIGSHLVNHALKQGHKVKALVLKNIHYERLKEANVELVFGDLADMKALGNACSDVDVIYHSAALLGMWGVSAQEMYQVNVEGVRNLIKACIKANIRHFIHLSASGVTGPLGKEVADESHKCKPYNIYTKTKLQGELLALEMADKYELPLTVIRPTFTYGPGDHRKLSLFKMVKKKTFVFIGNGKSTIHPVYIDDLVDGIELAAKHPPRGEVYIMGGERSVTKRELIYTIADSLTVPRPRIHIPVLFAELVARTLESTGKVLKFEPLITVSRVELMAKNWGLSIEKARREIGYEPKVNLLEGIKKTVEWYQKNGCL